MTCEFPDLEDTLRHQVIEKCRSDRVRSKLLERESDLKVADVISISQNGESVATQSRDIGGSVNKREPTESAELVSKIAAGKRPQARAPIEIKQRPAEHTCFRCKSMRHLAFLKNVRHAIETVIHVVFCWIKARPLPNRVGQLPWLMMKSKIAQ